ncbi:MAG: Rne/Rng family ribonuclease, partial [Pseudomonadota bacterium]
LREIVGELEVPQGMGLIVRTAGAERTRAEIKRDYEFLLRQWEQIRELTLRSTAPCLIYEEGSLIKRSIRDIYSKEIDAVLVEGEGGYREAKDYMKMLMPSHAKNVQQYSDTTPLFIRYQVESFLNGMFSPTVQLKSGGYIVIGITEALVAIDVNSGRSTREGSIEETAVKTNLEAADEVARQLRLRDLAGLIVIDFIDMDEGRNNRAVEKRMKDRLKNDRARIQVGRISAFGLMEMSRQRLRPGMLEATTKPCPHCHGQGFIRSDESMALAILREIEEEGVKGRSAEIVATMPVEICNYIVNSKRDHLARIEGRYGLSVQLLGDTSLTSPHYTIERAKGATRPERPVEAAVSASSLVEEHLSEDSADDEDTGETAAVTARGNENGRGSEDSAGKKRRRGRRGGRRRRTADEAGAEENGRASDAEADESAEATEPSEADEATTSAPQVPAEPLAEESEGNGRRRRRGRGKGRDKANGTDEAAAAADTETGETVEAPEPAEETVPQPDEDPSPDVGDTAEAPVVIEIDDPAAPVEEPADETAAAPAADAIIDGASAREDGLEETTGVIEEVAIAPEPEPQPEPVAEVADKPKRRGWWSLGR